MARIRLLALCLTVVLAPCAIAVAEASASQAFIYKVEGTKLEANETRGIVAKAKTEFTLKSKGALSVESVVKCKKLKLAAGERPMIVGGIPGTSEKEEIEFEECSATLGGSKCSSVAVENALTNNEIVAVVLPSGKAGKPAVLFRPAVGPVFTVIKLTKCGILGNQTAELEGVSAALATPEKTEATAGVLAWNSSEEITKVKNSNETEETVGLTSDGKLATINGEAEVELASKAVWGVFATTVVPQKIGVKKAGGGNTCAFTAKGQKCHILVINENSPVSGEEIEIVKQEVFEKINGELKKEEYFKKVAAPEPECESPGLIFPGTRLSPTELCNVEIELTKEPASKLIGTYNVKTRSRPARTIPKMTTY